MPKDRSARQTPFWQELFAERQIYLRTGQSSHYFLLSRSLQVGVALGTLVVIGASALGSYGYLSNRFQAIGQERGADAALETEAGQLRQAIEGLRSERDALQAEVVELRSAARSRGEEMTGVSGPPAGAESAGPNDDATARQFAEIKGSVESSPDEVLELKQDLAGAQATIAGLTADLTAPGRNSAGLKPRLLLAEARIAELESRLAVLAAGLVPLPSPQAPREASSRP